jgi:hypothetical protein
MGMRSLQSHNVNTHESDAYRSSLEWRPQNNLPVTSRHGKPSDSNSDRTRPRAYPAASLGLCRTRRGGWAWSCARISVVISGQGVNAGTVRLLPRSERSSSTTLVSTDSPCLVMRSRWRRSDCVRWTCVNTGAGLGSRETALIRWMVGVRPAEGCLRWVVGQCLVWRLPRLSGTGLMLWMPSVNSAPSLESLMRMPCRYATGMGLHRQGRVAASTLADLSWMQSPVPG